MKKAIRRPSFYEEPVETKIDQITEKRTDSAYFHNEECDRSLASHEFFECRFVNVTFTGKMAGCLFADVIFDHCDFSNCDMSETVCRRVEFRSCRMIGTEMIRSVFQDTLLSSCHCGYANFYGAKWKQSEWTDCRFSEAVLSGGKFSDTDIDRCDFTKAEFAETSLRGLDLSSSVIDGFVVGPNSLPGVIMNREQALACAVLLGIRVKN